ncbi:MAG: AAA family ATPase [Candidatus Aenigmarchaeota archaeon]|nr:AAA family ATPase [Candidatus Aenigmarchaeota archaeon]
MGKAICVSGSKGGIGKTTTAINLALSLFNKKENVILVDANFTSPNVGIYLGHPVTPNSIHEVLSNKIKLDEAMYLHKSGLKIIPGNISLDSLQNVNPSRLKNHVSKLKKEYDWVIIDSAAGLGRESLSALEASDEVLVVLNPELPSVTDALKTMRIAQELNIGVAGIALTRKRKRYDMSIKEIESMLESPVIAVIPEDDSIRKAQNKRDAVINLFPSSKVSKGYNRLSSYLLSESPSGEEREFTWKDMVRTIFGLK